MEVVTDLARRMPDEFWVRIAGDFRHLSNPLVYNKALEGPSMDDISREQLHAYLDDSLSDSETARIEKALRESEDMRQRLRFVREEQDRGEHSLGAIWRRERLSCPSREELNGYLHEIHDENFQAYIEFHLTTIACSTCLANLDDLKEKQAESGKSGRRRRKIFDSSSGLLSNLAADEK
jgi:hypothetical protein